MQTTKPKGLAKIWRGIKRPFGKISKWGKNLVTRAKSLPMRITQKVSWKEFKMAKNYFEWRNFLNDERLYACSSSEKQKDLFAKYVKFIEIEVFSFCNRQCWFCPNSYIDRHSQNVFMPEMMYEKIMNELAEIAYSGKIWYSRYNEPFSDRIILERIRKARQKLPNATLHSFTNGDYITREYLDDIASAGLNDMYIMRYPQGKCEYNESQQREILTTFAKKIGFPFEQRKNVSLEIFHPAMTIMVLGPDPQSQYCNRADSVTISTKSYRRKTPCYSPFTNMYIDHNGSVMPCCNMRSDVSQHAEMIMGNVAENTLCSIYANLHYSLLRYQMRDFGNKVYPCNVCDTSNFSFSAEVPYCKQ